MGMHTDEWIAQETSLDRAKIMGFSLNQEEYDLPMIKLTFGEEYVPIPQYQVLNVLLAGFSHEINMKSQFFEMARVDAEIRLGYVDKETGRYLNGYNRQNFGLFPKPNENPEYAKMRELICEELGKVIYEKGPYYVLGGVLNSLYSWEMDRALEDRPEKFRGIIGEEQDWQIS